MFSCIVKLFELSTKTNTVFSTWGSPVSPVSALNASRISILAAVYFSSRARIGIGATTDLVAGWGEWGAGAKCRRLERLLNWETRNCMMYRTARLCSSCPSRSLGIKSLMVSSCRGFWGFISPQLIVPGGVYFTFTASLEVTLWNDGWISVYENAHACFYFFVSFFQLSNWATCLSAHGGLLDENSDYRTPRSSDRISPYLWSWPL